MLQQPLDLSMFLMFPLTHMHEHGRQAGGGSCTDTPRGLQEHDGNLEERLKDCKHLLIALLLQQLCQRSLASSGMLLPPACSLLEL